ncbi:tetratricopeptide repeat protein [Massilia sp. 9096]|uniref:tetratricopeptide repeat protein n=1 Tax=Massilia sp. 9096 TaxID=1500894 RepID=UPI00068D5455|nr:tetratricopeptide repeat protein [Massilia sp. 9096]
MSLINKMLQDLDARGTPGQDAFPSNVKPVSAPERRAPALRLAALSAGALAVAGALGWFAWDRLHAAAPDKPAAVLAPVVHKADPAKPGLAMTGTITQLPATVPGAVPAVPAPVQIASSSAAPATAADVAPSITAGVAPPTPQPQAPSAPTRAAQAVQADGDGAPAPRPRLAAREGMPAREHAGARMREDEPAAAAAAPKSFLPMEPDSPEAREARRAAVIELATRQARLARIARLSAPAAGHKGAAGAEGRQESNAQRAENEYGRALADLQDGRMTEALAALQGALRIDPGHDAARQTLVGLLVEANRPEEAMRELESGLARDPRQPALAMLLARLQIERGGSGIETLTRSLPYAGSGSAESAEYHAFLAGALQRQGRQRDAAEQYQQALRTVPGNGVWWMGLGISLRADKRNAEALDAFQKARTSGGLSTELQAFVERQIAQIGR